MSNIELLEPLLGTWTGKGKGEYPTIESFEYLETMRFTKDERSLLFYDQNTQRLEGDGYVPSHWEVGFIRLTNEGNVLINNAQAGGRTELLTGTVTTTAPGLILELSSSSFLNDPLPVETTRHIEVNGDELRYTMHMQTKTNPEMAIHLEAKLKRAS